MGRFSSNFTFISLHFLLFFLFIFFYTSASDSPQGACAFPWVNCLQGTCRPISTNPLFECDCYPGWLKLRELPYCAIPNCTLNFDCGNGAPPPPPPPLPPFTLPNFSDPCFLVWCGDGNCIPDGYNHKCDCSDGTENFMGVAALPCFKTCNLGVDCSKLQLFPPISPPPPPPVSSSSPSPKMGLAKTSNSSKYRKLSTVLLLVGSLPLWIY